jgi:hypothetical protein
MNMGCKNLSITIERIRGVADDLGYIVGRDGVTEINAGSYSTEPYCERIFYRVHKGATLHSTVNDQAVAEIVYFPPEDES